MGLEFAATLFAMRIEELDYALSPEQIAQRPLECRDASRMLLLDRKNGQFEDRQFAELPRLLRGDELLVCNNTRVIPARLFGKRKGINAQTPSRTTRREHLQSRGGVFFTLQLESNMGETLVKPGRKLPGGEEIVFGGGEFQGESVVLGRHGRGTSMM